VRHAGIIGPLGLRFWGEGPGFALRTFLEWQPTRHGVDVTLTPIDALFRTEHAALVEAAEAATENLINIGRKLRPGSVHYAEHTVFADRCASLARYLDSAVGLAERSSYGPALALIRSALEHHYFDRLLFLGNRYLSVAKDVDESA
jgi:hypothetical protein